MYTSTLAQMIELRLEKIRRHTEKVDLELCLNDPAEVILAARSIEKECDGISQLLPRLPKNSRPALSGRRRGRVTNK